MLYGVCVVVVAVVFVGCPRGHPRDFLRFPRLNARNQYKKVRSLEKRPLRKTAQTPRHTLSHTFVVVVAAAVLLQPSTLPKVQQIITLHE